MPDATSSVIWFNSTNQLHVYYWLGGIAYTGTEYGLVQHFYIFCWWCCLSAYFWHPFHTVSILLCVSKNEDAGLLIRVAANLDFFKPGFSNFGFFLTPLAFFRNQKGQTKFVFFWLFFNRNGLALAKHCLSCIFITNLFWQEYMTMQGAKNIAKILLLLQILSMLFIRNKCKTV